MPGAHLGLQGCISGCIKRIRGLHLPRLLAPSTGRINTLEGVETPSLANKVPFKWPFISPGDSYKSTPLIRPQLL